MNEVSNENEDFIQIDTICKKVDSLSKKEISKLYINLIKRLELYSKNYLKMYNNGIKEIDTYSYVGVFRDLIDKSTKNI